MTLLGAEQTELVFNIFAPDVTADPYTFYARFREREPVYKTPWDKWFVTRHEDVALVLRDRSFGRDFGHASLNIYGPDWHKERCLATMAKWLLFLDPPDHTRSRALMAPGFAAIRIEQMRNRIQAIADRLIDKVEHLGRMEVIRDFALPLPMSVICEMLGVPEEDHKIFLEGIRISNRLIEPVPMNRQELDDANTLIALLDDYFRRLIEHRRRQPQDDLITKMVEAASTGARLSDEELAANLIFLFAAGYETTVNLIGNSLVSLYRHPSELERLRNTPAMLPDAVEELLRYESPAQLAARQVLKDIELGGKLLKKGDYVIASLGSANRDPAVYEDPDRLDLGRKNIRHFSFGGGIHFCLGAQLSRIELEVTLATFFRRLPQLRLENIESPDWRSLFVWRGLNSLRATWNTDDGRSAL